MFGRQMLNKTLLDLEHITVILFSRWLAYSGSISANGSNDSKQVSPFFSAVMIPAALEPLEVTCSRSVVVI